jgi:hypothetical protein
VVWVSIAAAYETNWPVGFFVGALGAVCYAAGRGWAAIRRHRGGAAWRHGRGARGPSGAQEHGLQAANVRV